ncbi:MAG: SPOR domain-containing protein [Burkholderiales bacterium]|jgi:DedD protein|nr:SPOR domain-containing protein [Burkholderiales bacterium]
MPWPFSRSEPEQTERDGNGEGRASGGRDPAAELRAQTRRRLIGAAALLLAAVIVLPMLLDTTPRPVREDVSITIVNPLPPVQRAQDEPPAVDEKMAEPLPIRSEPPPAAEPPPKGAAAAPAPAAAGAPPARPPAAAAATDKFAVQVAALSTAAAAREQVARLKKAGFSAYVEAVSTPDSTLHRVRVGPFASRDEAQRAAERLKAAGHKATVVGG